MPSINNKQVAKIRALSKVSSGGGSGLPANPAPYQQLVTDGEGNAKWEDRLAYKGIVESVVLPEQTAKIEYYQYFGYCQIGGFEPELYANEDGTEKDIKVGRTYIFTIDGVEYRCAAKYGVNNVSSGSKSVYIGNADVNGYGDQYDEDYEDTGEPFLFVPTYDGVYTLIMREEDEGEHTISLREVVEEVHPIAPGLLAAEHGANKVLVTDGNGESKWEEKPFGEELEVILPETVIEAGGTAGMTAYQKVADSVNLVEGEEYTVLYNGEEEKFICEIWSHGTPTPYIGDISQAEWEQSQYVDRFALKGTGSLTLGERAKAGDTIAVYKKTLKTLDPKFLPEGVGGGGIPTYVIYTEDGINYMLVKSDGNTVLTGEEVVALPWTEGMFVLMDVALRTTWEYANYRCVKARYILEEGFMILYFDDYPQISVNLDTGEIINLPG